MGPTRGIGGFKLSRGKLALCNLENCKRNQVKSAKLRLKRNILILTLVWSHPYICRKEFVECPNDEMVLERLEPNPGFKELTIRYLEQIPPLGNLPNLKEIELQQLESLKGFHGQSYYGRQPCYDHMRKRLEPLICNLVPLVAFLA
ncbi:NB-ARC domains-containing protein [Artemisia annua]|uniref:NB-ARC domains-containing protein n=1 Tax=Artemisia annua TaxID=35608 RepID=A0A2U1N3B4_ARTAN|nr:NB-ARC domains-containing protein [Artemisia annua]